MNTPVFLPFLLFALQLFATVAMTGIIWFVQVVHYPLFALIPDPHHAQYAVQHQRRTGLVVGPLMALELLTALLALFSSLRPSFVTRAGSYAGCAMLAAIWLATAFVQVPAHNQLLSGMKEATVRRLVVTNWIRSIAWTVRSILLISSVARLA